MSTSIRGATASTSSPTSVSVNPQSIQATPETTPQPTVNPPTGNPAPKFQVNPAPQQLRKLTGGITR